MVGGRCAWYWTSVLNQRFYDEPVYGQSSRTPLVMAVRQQATRGYLGRIFCCAGNTFTHYKPFHLLGWKPFRCGSNVLEFVSMRENIFQLTIHSLSKQITIYSRNKQTDLFALGRLRPLYPTISRHLGLRRLVRVAELLSFWPLTTNLRRCTEFQGFGKHNSVFRLFAIRASEMYREMRSGCTLV